MFLSSHPTDKHIDSAIIALDAKAKDTTPSNKEGEGEKNADWAQRMQIYLGKSTKQNVTQTKGENSLED